MLGLGLRALGAVAQMTPRQVKVALAKGIVAGSVGGYLAKYGTEQLAKAAKQGSEYGILNSIVGTTKKVKDGIIGKIA